MRYSMILAMLSVLAVSHPAQAAIELPAPGPDLTRQFGSFEVFSLPFLENLFGRSFRVPSGPGQIKDGVVIMTGTSSGPATTNAAGIDNAYPTPSGVSGNPFFDTKDVTDPSGGDPSPDFSSTWDAEVGALRSFLANMGSELVIYFNLNDDNSIDGLAGQDMLAWAKIDLVDTNPLDGTAATKTFFLSAADDPLTVGNELADGLAASLFGAPEETDGMGGPTATPGDARWANIHGKITVAADGSFLHFGGLNGSEPAGAKEINQNLGADEAAFAIFNSELNDLVKNPSSPYTSLRAEIVTSWQDNGFEQAFIHPMTNLTFVIPEPVSLIVWSGLIGLVVCRRRRMS